MPTLSQRLSNLHASPIREILAVIQQPGMISFAGGLPDPTSFTRPAMAELPLELLQYGASEGELALREKICEELRALGLACDPTQIIIVSGSQQGIDLVAKLTIDAGTVIAVDSPTYLAALQVFRFFGGRFIELQRNQRASMLQGQQATLCYVNPTFQNPTGYCYNQLEREALAQACQQHDVLLFEDDPYRDLAYDTCDRTPICSLMKKGSWVYQGSFSKTYAPGLRLGFMAASKNLMSYLVSAKQAADLHSNRLSQHLVLQALQSPTRQHRLQELQTHYRSKRDYFAQVLEKYMYAHARWHVPQGGLFFWLQLKQRFDTQALLQKALEQQVAFMPGEPFIASAQPEHSYVRLNFSHASSEQVEWGISRLAKLCATHSHIAPHSPASV